MRWIAVLTAAWMLAGCATTGEPETSEEVTSTELTPEEEMQLQVAAATPGEQHARLAKQVGDWDVKGRIWMAADGEPMDVTAVARTYLVLGGRFLAQEYKANFAGMEMEGLTFWGYDNIRKKHIGILMDSFGTAIATSQGREVAADGSLTMYLQSIWPDGTLMYLREVIEMRGAEGMTYRVWLRPKEDPRGEGFMAAEMEYTPKR